MQLLQAEMSIFVLFQKFISSSMGLMEFTKELLKELKQEATA
jgi:hypothetical protein